MGRLDLPDKYRDEDYSDPPRTHTREKIKDKILKVIKSDEPILIEHTERRGLRHTRV